MEISSTAGKITWVTNDLSMNNHKVTRLAMPEWKGDAVNKEYVDGLPRGMTPQQITYILV